VPPPLTPESIRDASWVIITHDHIDHCDLKTLPAISKASPDAKFIGPPEVLLKLQSWGIEKKRLFLSNENSFDLSKSVRITVIPAAHPVIARDQNCLLKQVGYVFTSQEKHIYHAGDTFVAQELISALQAFPSIHTAFLPVNEHNFFRKQINILGNMSIREAFLFAELIKSRQVIPIHWDMFAVNSVTPAEMFATYRALRTNPFFKLKILRSSQTTLLR
jgi:L-ascorbate metabolism protein UlaG (beta-lactamase superfamily)